MEQPTFLVNLNSSFHYLLIFVGRFFQASRLWRAFHPTLVTSFSWIPVYLLMFLLNIIIVVIPSEGGSAISYDLTFNSESPNIIAKTVMP